MFMLNKISESESDLNLNLYHENDIQLDLFSNMWIICN